MESMTAVGSVPAVLAVEQPGDDEADHPSIDLGGEAGAQLALLEGVGEPGPVVLLAGVAHRHLVDGHDAVEVPLLQIPHQHVVGLQGSRGAIELVMGVVHGFLVGGEKVLARCAGH